MRIMLVTMDYPPPMGGIQIVTRNLVEDLKSAGYEVCLLNFDGRNTNNYKRLHPLDFVYSKATQNEYFRSRKVLNLFKIFKPSGYREYVYNNLIYRETNKVRKSFNPDVTHILKPTLFTAIYECQEPFIVSCHGEELQAIFPVIYSLRNATVIHCVSEYSKSLVLNKFGAYKNIEVINNSIPFDSSIGCLETRKPIILTCCRLVKRKNVENILKALSILPCEINLNYKYIVIGDGPEKASLINLARKLGLNNVIFLGQLSEDDKNKYFRQSKLFVLCPKPYEASFEANEEGFGISFIEAQSFGLPVVGSNIGGIPESVGEGGLLVQNPTDPSEIAFCILNLLQDKQLYQRLRNNALSRIKQFDRKFIFPQYEQLYLNVLKNAEGSKGEIAN